MAIWPLASMRACDVSDWAASGAARASNNKRAKLFIDPSRWSSRQLRPRSPARQEPMFHHNLKQVLRFARIRALAQDDMSFRPEPGRNGRKAGMKRSVDTSIFVDILQTWPPRFSLP